MTQNIEKIANMSETNTLEPRISVLEAGQEMTNKSLETLGNGLNHLANTIEKRDRALQEAIETRDKTLQKAITDLGNQFYRRNENKWSTLAPLAAIIVAGLVGYITMVTRPLERQINDNQRIIQMDDANEVQLSYIAGETNQRLLYLEKKIDDETK